MCLALKKIGKFCEISRWSQFQKGILVWGKWGKGGREKVLTSFVSSSRLYWAWFFIFPQDWAACNICLKRNWMNLMSGPLIQSINVFTRPLPLTLELTPMQFPVPTGFLHLPLLIFSSNFLTSMLLGQMVIFSFSSYRPQHHSCPQTVSLSFWNCLFFQLQWNHTLLVFLFSLWLVLVCLLCWLLLDVVFKCQAQAHTLPMAHSPWSLISLASAPTKFIFLPDLYSDLHTPVTSRSVQLSLSKKQVGSCCHLTQPPTHGVLCLQDSTHSALRDGGWVVFGSYLSHTPTSNPLPSVLWWSSPLNVS